MPGGRPPFSLGGDNDRPFPRGPEPDRPAEVAQVDEPTSVSTVNAMGVGTTDRTGRARGGDRQWTVRHSTSKAQ